MLTREREEPSEQLVVEDRRRLVPDRSMTEDRKTMILILQTRFVMTKEESQDVALIAVESA